MAEIDQATERPEGEGEAYDATNPRHVEGRRKREKLFAQRADAAIAALMQHADGRLWVWRLLSMCGVYQSSYAHAGIPMAFNEGRRDIGLHLLGDLHRLCPDLYAVMTKENATNG